MYAVVDVETTGLSPRSDRIIEVAVVGLDESGNQQWSWSTLINPRRDVGPTSIHGITATEVINAPTFDEVAGQLAQLLNGRLVVGHNVAFDWRMLCSEFERFELAVPNPMVVICTCNIARASGLRPATLDACLAVFHLTNPRSHSALDDAIATASLLAAMVNLESAQSRANLATNLRAIASWPAIPIRDTAGIQRSQPLSASDVSPAVDFNDAPQLETLPILDPADPLNVYSATLERVLEDRIITEAEALQLESLAHELGLSNSQTEQAHNMYLRGFAGAAWADGRISESEHRDLDVVAHLLGLPADSVTSALQTPLQFAPAPDNQLRPGDRVVFTGDMDLPRDEWQGLAKQAGLKVTSSVSRLTKFVVAADANSQSEKASRARELGVRIVNEATFSRRLRAMNEAVQ